MTSRVFEVIQAMSGQGNTISIPRPYLDFFAGDPQAHLLGAILNQLVFWSGKSELMDGWFYKSYEAIAGEIRGVTKDQVRKATGKLLERYFKGVIEHDTRKVNGTPVKHYRVDGDALIARIFPQTLETAILPHGNGNTATSETAILPDGNGNTATSMETAILPDGNGNTATSFLYPDLKNTDLKDQKISSSENSKKLSDEQKTRDFLTRHPDAVVYTTAGKSWGTQEDLDCAGWIWERVKIINPTQRVPNWTEWANDVRLLRQIDGRTHKQICQLFKRANLDKFWCSNVLCPAKLREKWDVLTAKFNTGDFHAQTTGESNAMRQVREALDRWEQGDDPHRVGDGDENLRPVVDCEEWHCTGSDVGGADWEFDQRPDDERV
ncbi:replication protein 15 [Enterobacter hormaechei]|uniref:replication protein 15 n=1 Tax=Enterobacter hormaechei TaxID=158836 RepID=UPI002A76422B|nr:replication protein 15 [Enterobacter hormaechei]MDY3570250.1 replication protein 15 [Enterobacter hormaechei]